MKYLLMVGMALVIFGICFLVTFCKEKAKRYIVVQGKVIEVVKSLGVGKGFTYTPIFEYQYNNKTFRVAHRISSFTPNCTYKVNDVVELRVYEDKPDKAIVNSKKNLIMPLVSGISSIILGIVFVILYMLYLSNSQIPVYLSNPLKTLYFQGFSLALCSNLMYFPLFLPL